jgi:hypothetical protein
METTGIVKSTAITKGEGIMIIKKPKNRQEKGNSSPQEEGIIICSLSVVWSGPGDDDKPITELEPDPDRKFITALSLLRDLSDEEILKILELR